MGEVRFRVLYSSTADSGREPEDEFGPDILPVVVAQLSAKGYEPPTNPAGDWTKEEETDGKSHRYVGFARLVQHRDPKPLEDLP